MKPLCICRHYFIAAFSCIFSNKFFKNLLGNFYFTEKNCRTEISVLFN